MDLKKEFRTIDEYIGIFPADIRQKLQDIRQAIKKAAPTAKEVISYNIPAFKAKSVLVYFAAFKNHIGFYPTAKPIVVFQKELSAYATSKGAIQFPLDKKIPLALVTKITKFRLAEDMQKHEVQKKVKD